MTGNYHLTLTDTEREAIQLQSHNFHLAHGYRMRVPPRLYEDLKAGGVDMKHIEADPALEGMGGPPQ